MRKIICFLCLMSGLFFMGCKKDIVDTKLKVEEPIMDIEKEEETKDFDNDIEKDVNEKNIIVYDNGPQKNLLIKALIEHGNLRETYFEICGYYPGEYPYVEPVKYSQEILDSKN